MDDAELLDWLLDSDPALRWQVERDLLHAPAAQWQETRARVAAEGFGAQLLAHQDPDGQWAGGAFFPRDFQDAPEDEPQPWTATTWSLNALREWGVPASALDGTAAKLEASSRWEYDDLPYWGGEVDCCINAYTVANGVWLGADIEGIVDWLIGHRLADGGWNCEWIEGSTRSSFHSTLNTLNGLLAYDVATGGTEATRDARTSGGEYLLERHLFRRLSTGGPVGAWATRFSYPNRWAYNVLSAAEYFRSASLHDRTPPDPRMAEAIEIIRAARQPDGTWTQQRRHPGRVWFEVDAEAGEPSKWVTFQALRVLEWWDAAADGAAGVRAGSLRPR